MRVMGVFCLNFKFCNDFFLFKFDFRNIPALNMHFIRVELPAFKFKKKNGQNISTFWAPICRPKVEGRGSASVVSASHSQYQSDKFPFVSLYTT